LLARAKQATQFVADVEKGGHSVVNPFSGLSDRQLDAVIYDDSGTYTVNERRAADFEVGNRNYTWEKKLQQKALRNLTAAECRAKLCLKLSQNACVWADNPQKKTQRTNLQRKSHVTRR